MKTNKKKKEAKIRLGVVINVWLVKLTYYVHHSFAPICWKK